jgi:hypothetical protein
MKRVQDLCRRLAEYAKPDGFGAGPQDQLPQNVLARLNSWNVQRRAENDLIPTAGQQVDAINRISSWFESHYQRLPPEMSSEPSIQDEIYIQLLNPLNILLQVSYEVLASV